MNLGQLSVPANIAFTRAVLAYTGQVGQVLAFDEQENNALQLAVDEAFCNAVTHYGAAKLEAETINVDFALIDSALVVSIRERGIPFDPTQAMPYSTDSFEAALKPGIGMRLMQRCVDKVEFLAHGRDGKEVRLTKRLRSEARPQALVAAVPERKRITVKEPEVRLVRRDELLAVSKLAWNCYGYSHVATLYDTAKLLQRYDAGSYVPIAAFDPATGEMFGHECLKFNDPATRVPELGLAFVDTHYRCAGASAQMARELFAWARMHGCAGVYDTSVTTHTQSQKQLQEQLGSAPCGMFLAFAPRGLRVKELATDVQPKGSVINHYFALDRSEATLYPPANHREMVREIYEWLQLPRALAEAAAPAPTGESIVEVQNLPEEQNADIIVVRRIGADCLERIRESMKASRWGCKDAVYAFLPLQSPQLPALFAECEQLGLSFAGVMPHIHFGEDRILLHWINTPLDMESIHVHGDRSRKLFAYIRTCLDKE